MKILLLTDAPPCGDFAAGPYLDQLCRFLPPGSIACFAMVSPDLYNELSGDPHWIPTAYTRNRDEASFRPFPGALSLATAWTVEKLYRRCVAPRLAQQAVEFGRAQNVDLVWAVLQGQTITQIAPGIARALGVPLITQVLGPPAWWLLTQTIDRANSRSALADFDRALLASRTCITTSSAMARTYEARYGTRSVPIVAGHQADWARSPTLDAFPSREVRIGMAGQFYGGAEWSGLIHALNMSGWQVRGKAVKLIVLGVAPPASAIHHNRVRYLGEHSPPAAVDVLSGLDLLYFPYPFDKAFEEVTTLCFPSAFSLYLAAGRPILFHGPNSSSPADYLREHNAGVVVARLNATAVYNELCRLVDNPQTYRTLGGNSQRAFRRDFTLTNMRRSFEHAIEIALDQIPTSTQESVLPIHCRDVSTIPYSRHALTLLRLIGQTSTTNADSRRTASLATVLKAGLLARIKSPFARVANPLLFAWIQRMIQQRDTALRSAALDSHTVFVHLSRVSHTLLTRRKQSAIDEDPRGAVDTDHSDSAVVADGSKRLNGGSHDLALLKMTMADLERLVTEIRALEARLETLQAPSQTVLKPAERGSPSR